LKEEKFLLNDPASIFYPAKLRLLLLREEIQHCWEAEAAKFFT